MRVLLIEENEKLAQAITVMLSRGGAVVETAEGGEDGLDLAKNYDFDLIVLDMGVTDISGQAVIKSLRRNKVVTPILAIQAKATTKDGVDALNAGADDHLAIPFAAEELIARAMCVFRRSRGFASSDITMGDLVLNVDTKGVRIGGREVHLTGKEYQVLELLVMRRDTAVTKEMMLNHLYGGMDEPEAKIIDVFVCKLRKKIKSAVGAEITTVWGRGYVMVETAPAAAVAPLAAKVA